jgi:DNA-binding transcriptional LysR family regulator
MRDIFLHSIETFTQVIERQSFSAAAEQPAVRKQIRMLERHLGVWLVDRAGKRSVPTQAGAALPRHAQAFSRTVVPAWDDASQHGPADGTRDEEKAALLRLGVEPSAGYLLPPSFWRGLRLRLPELEVKVHSWTTAEIARGLEQGGIDMGLVVLPTLAHSFDVRFIMQDELLLVASRKGKLPTKLTPAALAELPLLAYEPGGEMGTLLQGWFGKSGLHPIMKIGDIEVIKRLVMARLGYSILPGKALSRTDRQKLTLRRLTPRLYRKLALIVGEGEQSLRPAVQEAVDVFHAVAATLAPGPTEFPLQPIGA